MRVVYLIGAPGSGKSTATRNAVDGWPVIEVRRRPFALTIVDADGVRVGVLGRLDAEFPGTDTLSMAVQPLVLDWIASSPDVDIVFGEGDRLGNASFVECVAATADLTLAVMTTSAIISARRSADRAIRLGRPPQSDSWMRGRQTKVRNVIAAARRLNVKVVELDADHSGDALRALIRNR